MQLAPSRGADPTAHVVAESEDRGQPRANDPEPGPELLEAEDKRDRDAAESRGQVAVAEENEAVRGDRAERGQGQRLVQRLQPAGASGPPTHPPRQGEPASDRRRQHDDGHDPERPAGEPEEVLGRIGERAADSRRPPRQSRVRRGSAPNASSVPSSAKVTPPHRVSQRPASPGPREQRRLGQRLGLDGGRGDRGGLDQPRPRGCACCGVDQMMRKASPSDQMRRLRPVVAIAPSLIEKRATGPVPERIVDLDPTRESRSAPPIRRSPPQSTANEL